MNKRKRLLGGKIVLLPESGKSSPALDFGKILENIPGVSLAAGAIFYLFGFIIENTFLGALGIRKLEIINPSLLVTGIVYLASIIIPVVLLLIPIAPKIRSMIEAENLRSGYNWIFAGKLLLITALYIFLASILFVGLLYVVTNSRSDPGQINEALGFLSVFAVISWLVVSLVIIVELNFHLERKRINTPIKFTSAFLILIVVLGAFLWSTDVYLYIDQQYAGGEPSKAVLLISQEAPGEVFSELKIGVNGIRTDYVLILVESLDEIIILTVDNDVAKIPKEFIDTIIYVGK